MNPCYDTNVSVGEVRSVDFLVNAKINMNIYKALKLLNLAVLRGTSAVQVVYRVATIE